MSATTMKEKQANLSEEEINARHAEKMRKKKIARDKIMATKTIEKGLLIVHTGKGKGSLLLDLEWCLECLATGTKLG